mgnify:CR=1 FL=1
MNPVKTTVLVIEDEGYILRILESVLTAGGYQVITAQNGLEAQLAISSYVPDIILLDLGLPDMDGLQILTQLRQWTKMPVIVVSARSTEKDKVTALDNGADDYISKPFSAPELLARMRAVLRRNTPTDTMDGAYRVGEFCINFEKRQVTVDNGIVHLTQIEYRIVELIARQSGKVLTYGQIIRNIWGPFADVNNNRIVRVNMSNIRQKIEKDRMAPKYILTEIGVGYRMAEKDEQHRQPEVKV